METQEVEQTQTNVGSIATQSSSPISLMAPLKPHSNSILTTTNTGNGADNSTNPMLQQTDFRDIQSIKDTMVVPNSKLPEVNIISSPPEKPAGSSNVNISFLEGITLDDIVSNLTGSSNNTDKGKCILLITQLSNYA